MRLLRVSADNYSVRGLTDRLREQTSRRVRAAPHTSVPASPQLIKLKSRADHERLVCIFSRTGWLRFVVPIEGYVHIQEIGDFVPKAGRGLDNRIVSTFKCLGNAVIMKNFEIVAEKFVAETKHPSGHAASFGLQADFFVQEYASNVWSFVAVPSRSSSICVIFPICR